MNSRVKENAIPALVGVGALLLGVGQPRMTKPAGRIAIAQGRRNRTLSITCQQEESKRTTRRNTVDVVPSVNVQHEKKSTSSEPPLLNIAELKYHTSQAGFIDKESINYSHSLHDLHGGKAFSRYIKNAQQKINQKITRYQQTDDDENRPYSSSSLSNHLSIYDPNLTALGQSSVPTNTPLSPALSNSCCCSTDEIQHKHSKLSCSSVSLTSSSSVSTSDDEEIKSPLFHSNYFRSEMQFILALVDIATRLVIVPKEARMSALHAELTLLNQHLPAEICLPLWCPATSEKPFHQCIVRISPSDAVVLNSAERVTICI
jgi:phosphatidylinositol 4-kinase